VIDRSLRSASRKSIDKGTSLIRVAATLLERSNGDGFTVREVADEAGYSSCTLHQYFESNDDLLLDQTWNDPVRGDSPHDPERCVLPRFDVLAQHRGQQLARLAHCLVDYPTVEHFETPEPVAGHPIDQRFAFRGIIPSDLRSRVRPVLVVGHQRRPKFGFETGDQRRRAGPGSRNGSR